MVVLSPSQTFVLSKNRNKGIFVYSVLRPSKGFGGFREKGYLVSGIRGEGSFIFRDLGRKHNFLGF